MSKILGISLAAIGTTLALAAGVNYINNLTKEDKTTVVASDVSPNTSVRDDKVNEPDNKNPYIEENDSSAKSDTPTDTPSAPAMPEQESTACLIKGNISNKGEKIYHLPGQRFYDKTIISTNKGERWFCTEKEAIAAGWRKSKV